jgi:hypothetical protein
MSSLAVMPTLHEFADRIKKLERQLEERNRQLEEAQDDLRAERSKNAQGAAAVAELRRQLSPLYNGLRAVFGEMDALGVAEGTSGHVEPRKAAVWEAWKTKLPGIPAKMIDALLVHGALNQTQLRIHAQCARSSVPNAVMALNRAGLINKSGDGKISLKEL